MSDEIQYRHDASGQTLYAVAVNDKPGADYGKYWNGAAWEALAVANWGDYDIALTETPSGSYLYVGDFPAADAGQYKLLVFEQAGGSPAISDDLLAESTLFWDGSAAQSQAAGLLAGDVDSTGTPLTAREALELLFAWQFGRAAWDADAGTWTIYGRDGTTVLATLTLNGSGNRAAPSL